MGVPKHRLTVHGENILDRILDRIGILFEEVLVVGRDLEIEKESVQVVEDVLAVRTPLVGILSGALVSKNDTMFVMGCDMPFIKPDVIQCVLSNKSSSDDIAVPFVGGFYEPLCAAYSSSLAGTIGKYVSSGGRRIAGLYELVNVKLVVESEILAVDPNMESFINLNTPSDWEGY